MYKCIALPDTFSFSSSSLTHSSSPILPQSKKGHWVCIGSSTYREINGRSELGNYAFLGLLEIVLAKQCNCILNTNCYYW